MASSRQPNFGRSNFKLLPLLRRVQSGVPKTAGGTEPCERAEHRRRAAELGGRDCRADRQRETHIRARRAGATRRASMSDGLNIEGLEQEEKPAISREG